MAVPTESFTDDFLLPERVDKSMDFARQCGQNHFYVDPNEQGKQGFVQYKVRCFTHLGGKSQDTAER